MELIKNSKVLVDEKALDARLCELADEINRDFAGEKVIIVGVLKGSFMFMSDLLKKINLDTEIYFLKAESYGKGTESSGTVKITKDIERDIKGENVIVVEDIIDTGLTLSYLRDELNKRGAASVKICTLLNKEARREKPVHVDYVGFSIENEFVIGYGLDYNEKYRNLPYIGILKLDD